MSTIPDKRQLQFYAGLLPERREPCVVVVDDVSFKKGDDALQTELFCRSSYKKFLGNLFV
jgi:hypothetical protein